MWKFLLRRLFISAIILFIIALIVYTILRCLPTSYIEMMAQERSSLPGGKSYSEVLAQLKEVYKMDDSILKGFFAWVGGSLLKGNFGDSWVYNVPVLTKFKEVIWDSFYLGFAALTLQLVIAIPLGILAARKQYRKTDYAVTVFALVGISLPSFFFATLLKLVFAFKLNWLEPIGKISRFHGQMSGFGQAMDIAAHFILPVMTLTIASIGFLMRYTRTNMLEVLNSDYIRTARAKGLSERTVINKHAFRNTLIPIVTIVGGTLPGLFAGAMIIEQLFSIPGIGYTSYHAMVKGDLPFSMFYMLFLAALTLLGTLIADILYAVVDPRVRVN